MPLGLAQRSDKKKKRGKIDQLQEENEKLLAELEEAYEQLNIAMEGSALEAGAAYGELVRRVHSLEQVNQQLKAMQDQMLLSERNATMGQMAAEIGHELKNYLAVMRGRAEMVPIALEKGDTGTAERAAAIILEQADRMDRLSKGLMDFSSQKTEICGCCMNELIAKVIYFLEPSASTQGVEFFPLYEDGIPQIEVDRAQIEQMMLNLFKNALDAMKGKVGRIVISTRYVKAEDMLEIAVQDEGPGMPESMISQVFESRFSTKERGRGFGLAVCYRIAKNHGGNIEIESSEGMGSVFVVTLPRKQ